MGVKRSSCCTHPLVKRFAIALQCGRFFMRNRGLLATLAFLALASAAQARNSTFPGERETPEQRRALAALDRNVDIQLDEQDVPSHVMGRLSPRVEPDPGL